MPYHVAITGFYSLLLLLNIFSAFDIEIEKIRSIENFIHSLPERPISLNAPHETRNFGVKYKTQKELFYRKFFENYQIQDQMSDSWALKALQNKYH